jgi:hypothetical protein
MTSNNITRHTNWESLWAPIVLMAAGALVLTAANLGIISLDKVQDLWPVSIVLVGLAELFPDNTKGHGNDNE